MCVCSLCSLATMASSKIRRSGPSSKDVPRIGEIRVWLQRLSVQGKIKVMDPVLAEELKSTVEGGNHLDCFEIVCSADGKSNSGNSQHRRRGCLSTDSTSARHLQCVRLGTHSL